MFKLAFPPFYNTPLQYPTVNLPNNNPHILLQVPPLCRLPHVASWRTQAIASAYQSAMGEAGAQWALFLAHVVIAVCLLQQSWPCLLFVVWGIQE